MVVNGPGVSQQSSQSNKGIYIFLLRLMEPQKIRVGALGNFLFPDGWYIYTGRAKQNLHKRVEHHWASKEYRRWHIDYLTAAERIEPIGAVLLTTDNNPNLDECWVNQRVGRMLAAETIVPGFGASDCHQKCPAHLWFSFRPISLLEITPLFPMSALLLPPVEKVAVG